MRKVVHNLWRDESGVSEIIGAILLFVIVAAVFGTIQAFRVPEWNKDVEYEHLDTIYNDMMTLKSDVEDVSISQEPKSSNIHMGVRYPNRIFLANPGTGIAGSLSSENVAVSVNYTIDAPGNPTITKNYTSNRIIYEAHGTIDNPKLVYEHGVLIKDYGNESASADEQSLIIGDDIYIPVLTGSLTSISSMDTASINLKPLTLSSSRTRIKSVSISLDTDYPEVWEQLLAGTDTAKTTVAVNLVQGKITITSTAIKQIDLPTGEVTTDALYTGVVTCRTQSDIVTGTSIDTSQNYPCILDISIDEGSSVQTQSTITVTVRNATAPFDIHADLTALTNDPTKYDALPDYSSPDGITATSWNVPNENTVRWTNITHPTLAGEAAVIITFWVRNNENNMQFFTSRIFIRKNANSWY
jgi:hypothetical protein